MRDGACTLVDKPLRASTKLSKNVKMIPFCHLLSTMEGVTPNFQLLMSANNGPLIYITKMMNLNYNVI